ncbi:hypothetical protein BDK51DRAFT_38528 [Blyttiomyces helicus]|uniref:Uncharacterized protein n=1 Tax=Blyttiomyces helicus TaxID=388810 RepID=A0A4P9VZ38_9FUNG|nr:hypothetical protein BDK51DRAFT_38528 [Blyttiomyces helicus]|eukprot:RKO85069.1 hypothetical protein BDK51DRAFT_38528 [Blyttiomyces helicus]
MLGVLARAVSQALRADGPFGASESQPLTKKNCTYLVLRCCRAFLKRRKDSRSGTKSATLTIPFLPRHLLKLETNAFLPYQRPSSGSDGAVPQLSEHSTALKVLSTPGQKSDILFASADAKRVCLPGDGDAKIGNCDFSAPELLVTQPGLSTTQGENADVLTSQSLRKAISRFKSDSVIRNSRWRFISVLCIGSIRRLGAMSRPAYFFVERARPDALPGSTGKSRPGRVTSPPWKWHIVARQWDVCGAVGRSRLCLRQSWLPAVSELNSGSFPSPPSHQLHRLVPKETTHTFHTYNSPKMSGRTGRSGVATAQRQTRTKATFVATQKAVAGPEEDTPTVRQRLAEARKTGVLDLRHLGLSQIPVDATKLAGLTALLL